MARRRRRSRDDEDSAGSSDSLLALVLFGLGGYVVYQWCQQQQVSPSTGPTFTYQPPTGPTVTVSPNM